MADAAAVRKVLEARYGADMVSDELVAMVLAGLAADTDEQAGESA